jgi:SAM-dependent methyltransferase
VFQAASEAELPPYLSVVGRRRAVCPGCGADAAHVRVSVPGDPGLSKRWFYSYALCEGCGTLRYDDRPVSGDELYGAHYYSHANRRPRGFKGQLWRIRNALTLYGPSAVQRAITDVSEHPVLPRLVPVLSGEFGRRIGRRDRWLDIGCGGGALLSDLKAIGFTDLTGVDPYMVQERHERGFRLLKSDGVSLGERFDVVMMHHALEHVPDPEDILRGLHSILAPDGVVLIRIPVAASYAWRAYGGEWVNLDAPRHFTLFSREGFEAAAARTHWAVRRVTYDAAPRTLYASEARIRGYCERATNVRALFNREELAGWAQLANALRRSGDSDEAAFYLTQA